MNSQSFSSNYEEPLEELASFVVEYLKSKYHEEAPHISVLSPDILAVWLFEKRQTILEAEEGEELELLESQLDPQRIRGNSTFGVRALFKDYSDKSQIEFRMCFYFRVAYPAEYRKAELSLRISGFDSTTVRMEVYDQNFDKTGAGCLTFERSVSFSSGKLLVGFGVNDIIEPALKSVNELIYGGRAEAVLLAEPDVVNALSTLPKNSAGCGFGIGAKPNQTHLSTDVKAVQNFIVEVAVVPHDAFTEVQIVFRYLCPSLVKDGKSMKVEQIPRFMYDVKPNVRNRWKPNVRNRWSLDRLLEVEGYLKWVNCRKGWSWYGESNKYAGLSGLTPIGCLAVERDDALLLRDWHIAVEEVEGIEGSSRSVDDSFDQIVEKIAKSANSISTPLMKKAARAVLYALEEHSRIEGKQIKSLYTFQEEALEEGLKALLTGEHKVIVLTTRTAGGKTLAFLLPLLIWIAYKRIAGGERGVKALLFYPTKALANDQANLILKLVWYLNHQPEAPEILELKKPISLGILHGQSPYREEQHEREEEVRLTCPLCGSRLVLVWNKEEGFYRERILCKNSGCELSQPSLSWMLEEILKVSREAIYSDPPDILIATPDIINARLVGVAARSTRVEEDPASLAILGMSNYYCANCGAVFCTEKHKCPTCEAMDIRKHEKLSHPEVIVIDEGHLLRGAFGAQASHLLTRLEQAIRTINGLDDSWRPVYFMSSATLSNPEDVACGLIASERSCIRVIRCKTSEHKSRTHRVHIFLMPKTYTLMSTASRALEALYSEKPSAVKLNASLLEELLSRSSEFKRSKPGCIVFVNTLAEANELIGRLRSIIGSGVWIDGHSTDYDRDRAMKEDMFTRGEIDILVATRGLEVGVDYSRARIGVIYGMPFFLSDYTQRIGRIGRNTPSIIINMFMPDKPIDHFYYTNWLLLCDNYLRSSHIQATEAYLINRSNPEAVRRSGKRAVIDYLSLRAGHLMERSLSKEVVSNEVERLIDPKTVVNYVHSALRVHEGEVFGMLVQSVEELLDEIKRGIREQARLRQVISNIGNFTWLWSLRTAEKEVQYRFPLLRQQSHRTRELSYAFRHCVPGQVISYREAFYVIDMVSADELRWEEEP
jgi:ATP-dependent helicase YprA (DUF1998 family)